MRYPGAVQPEGEGLRGCTRNKKRLTMKMASDDLRGVFENERTADPRVVTTASCLEIPLRVELNIVCGLALR
jgi:hypothetical protein